MEIFSNTWLHWEANVKEISDKWKHLSTAVERMFQKSFNASHHTFYNSINYVHCAFVFFFYRSFHILCSLVGEWLNHKVELYAKQHISQYWIFCAHNSSLLSLVFYVFSCHFTLPISKTDLFLWHDREYQIHGISGNVIFQLLE